MPFWLFWHYYSLHRWRITSFVRETCIVEIWYMDDRWDWDHVCVVGQVPCLYLNLKIPDPHYFSDHTSFFITDKEKKVVVCCDDIIEVEYFWMLWIVNGEEKWYRATHWLFTISCSNVVWLFSDIGIVVFFASFVMHVIRLVNELIDFMFKVACWFIFELFKHLVVSFRFFLFFIYFRFVYKSRVQTRSWFYDCCSNQFCLFNFGFELMVYTFLIK